MNIINIIQKSKIVYISETIENQECLYYEMCDEFRNIKEMEQQFLVAVNILFRNHKDFLSKFLDTGMKLYDRSHYLRIIFTEKDNKVIIIFMARPIENFIDKSLKQRVKRGRNDYLCVEMCWSSAYFVWLHEKFLRYYLEKGEIQNHNIFEPDNEDFGNK